MDVLVVPSKSRKGIGAMVSQDRLYCEMIDLDIKQWVKPESRSTRRGTGIEETEISNKKEFGVSEMEVALSFTSWIRSGPTQLSERIVSGELRASFPVQTW